MKKKTETDTQEASSVQRLVRRLYRCPKCKLTMRLADADVWGKIVRCTNCAEAVADNRTMPPPNAELSDSRPL